MDSLSISIIELLRFLLPGFLSAWVFYGFTSFEKPSQFERVVQALIFTLAIEVLVHASKVVFLNVSWVWGNSYDLFASFIFALLLGFLFAYFANNDWIHGRLRQLRISGESSYPSEWYGAFYSNPSYIVLHFADGRRLFGWPSEWPSSPESGHFLVENASWLDEDGNEEPLTDVSFMLISAQDVHLVEFVKSKVGDSHVKKST